MQEEKPGLFKQFMDALNDLNTIMKTDDVTRKIEVANDAGNILGRAVNSSYNFIIRILHNYADKLRKKGEEELEF